LKASEGKGNSFTFGNKEKEEKAARDLVNTNSSLVREEEVTPKGDSGSSIDTNELTDMEREKRVPETQPLGNIDRPMSVAQSESVPAKVIEVHN
jgi:hypothetical protein